MVFGNVDLKVAANGEGTIFKFSITNAEGSEGNTVQYKLNNTGEWVTAGADEIDIASADTIAIRVVRASTESVIAEAYEKENKLTVEEGVYGENGEVFNLASGVSYELNVTFTANTPGGVGSAENLELSGATSVTNGTFTTENGTATVEIGGEAYTGTANMWSIPALDTQIKVVLTANNGMKGVLRGGGFTIPDSCVSVSGQVTTYIFTLADLGATALSEFKSLSMAFESNSGGGGTVEPVPADAISFRVEGDKASEAIQSGAVQYSTDGTNWITADSASFSLDPGVASAQIKVTDSNGKYDLTSYNIIEDGGIITSGKVYTVNEKKEYHIQIDKKVYMVVWTYDPESEMAADAFVEHGKVQIISAVAAGQSEQWSGIEPTDMPGANNNQQDATTGGRVAIIPGSTVTVKIVPNYKYQFIAGKLNDTILTPDVNNVSTFTFTMPETNLRLTALFVYTEDQSVISAAGVSGATITGGEKVIDSGNLELTVKDFTDESKKTSLQASDAASGLQVSQWLEVDLKQVVNQGASDKYWKTSKDELPAKIKVTLTVGSDLDETKEYVVVREHNGVYERIPANYDKAAGTLTFESDKFSDYAVGTVVTASDVLGTINSQWPAGAASDASTTVSTLVSTYGVTGIAGVVQTSDGSVNTTLLEKLSALEEDYASEKNIEKKDPTVESAVAGSINGTVKVTGTRFNVADGNSVQLVIGEKAGAGITVNSSYSKAVQLNICLKETAAGSGSVSEVTGNLKMPVTITMPVPTGINASGLVILHDKDGNGTSDETMPYSLSGSNVTFTVTHFSNFAFAERTASNNGGDNGNNNGSGSDTSSESQSSSADTTADEETVSVPIEYTVVRGDTLSRIARKNNMTLSALMSLNPQIKNPNRIYPGQKIILGYTGKTLTSQTKVTTNSGAEFYIVQKGDFLYRIARKNGLTLNQLAAMNPEIMKQKYIYPGQKIKVK